MSSTQPKLRLDCIKYILQRPLYTLSETILYQRQYYPSPVKRGIKMGIS